VWYKNIAGRFFGLVTKHARDGRTDGQNYDSQDRTSIAASRGKKMRLFDGNLSTWAIFWRGWVTSIAHFRWKGTSPTNHC